MTGAPDLVAHTCHASLLKFGQGLHSVTPLWQGFTNGCGTTSLAMVLNALAASKGSSKKYTREKLDYRRPFNTYTSPQAIVQLAKDQGFYAGLYNQSSFQEIKAHLDKGHLIIALHNPEPHSRFSALHYVVIYDYQDGSLPSKQKLKLIDPVRREPEQARQEVSFADFNKKWRHLKQGPIPTGIDRFMVVVSNSPDLLPDRNIPVSLKIANTALTGINWYTNSGIEPIGRLISKVAFFPFWLLWQPLKFMGSVIRTFKEGFSQ
jgi:uncharacterized protein YvpB